MKKTFLLLLAAALFSSATIAQEKNVHKTFSGPDFEVLTVAGPLEVELIEADRNYVEVAGSYTHANAIRIHWAPGRLNISFGKNSSTGNPPVRVYVKKLASIQLEDGAKLVTTKPLHASRLKITVNGDSHARVINYGDIRVFSNEHIDVKRTTYLP